MHNKKRIGRKIDPCGTPHSILKNDEDDEDDEDEDDVALFIDAN